MYAMIILYLKQATCHFIVIKLNQVQWNVDILK